MIIPTALPCVRTEIKGGESAGGLDKKSETALTGLATSDVSFVRLSSRSVLLIANKLMSDI